MMRGLRLILSLRRKFGTVLRNIIPVLEKAHCCIFRIEKPDTDPKIPASLTVIESEITKSRTAARNQAVRIILETATRLDRRHGAASQGRVDTVAEKEGLAWRHGSRHS
jgi:hypothetical protein